MDDTRSVLLCGATGLVGGECLRLLVADPAFGRIVVLTRRPLPAGDPARISRAKIEEHVIDFDRLADQVDLVRVDQIVCALGTTIRQAGSQERFREVDLGYPLALARMGAELNVRHFLQVSAIGADARSRIFYNRVKGELEEALFALPYRSVTIVRPSLLLGNRAEFRPGEQIAKRFAFLMPARYRPVEASAVAAALVHAARENAPGRRIIESAEIPAIAAAYLASA
jgi:uncharacterized protein YbjT (DUF2867 family)